MEEERVVSEKGARVRALIVRATDTTAREVDPRLLKAIKSVVRNSDSELRLASEVLMDLMKRDHSQVRYLTLLIVDEIFMRSKLFRALLVENLDQLLTLSVGFRRTSPLPDPPAIATLLRSKAVEVLEKWNAAFGVHYRQLRLGFDYLKNTLKFQFPNLQANAARIQQERREREMRTREILRNKFESLRGNLSVIKDEIESSLNEIRECLDIVQNKDNNVLLAPLDDEEFEEFRSSDLKQIRLNSIKEGEKVHETLENEVLFDALREQYKLLESKHLVTIQEWISLLIRVEVEDNRLRDSMLKEFIDIRNQTLAVKKNCEESGCIMFKSANNGKEAIEEDFWEESEIGSTKELTSSASNSRDKDFTVATTPIELKNTIPDSISNSKSTENRVNNSKSVKATRFGDAPVLEWGSHLDNWGSNKEVLVNQRGLEFESHWGRVDYDAVIPAEKIAELNLKATLYEEEMVEIQPCRAPLRKGGLCHRRDLKVCPFHGPIIPRDDEGKPINQNSMNSESSNQVCSTDDGTFDYGSDDLSKKLGKQAVKNIRERDKEEATNKRNNKQLKRAKLAKVREHNEAVLRSAAMASTSRSAVIDEMEASNGGRSTARTKKESLASMLRKKVTPKDRLGQRLLNTRAKDSTTRQLNLGEDEKYREAFPNQW